MYLDCGIASVRDWAPGDIAALPQLANNPRIARNMLVLPSPYQLLHAVSWVGQCMDGRQRTAWAIEVDDALAGGVSLMLRGEPEAHSAGIAYWLGEPFWGRGIATAVVGGVCNYAFDELGLKRLDTAVLEWNPASMRVLEKCGFAREGVLRRSVAKEGRLVDRMMFARLAEDNDD